MSTDRIAWLRVPAAWALLSAALIWVLLAIVDMLVGDGAGQGSGSFEIRAGRAFDVLLGFQTIAAPALAVVVACYLGAPVARARAIAFAALGVQLLSGIFGGVAWLVVIVLSDFSARVRIETFLMGAVAFVLFVLAVAMSLSATGLPVGAWLGGGRGQRGLPDLSYLDQRQNNRRDESPDRPTYVVPQAPDAPAHDYMAHQGQPYLPPYPPHAGERESYDLGSAAQAGPAPGYPQESPASAAQYENDSYAQEAYGQLPHYGQQEPLRADQEPVDVAPREQRAIRLDHALAPAPSDDYPAAEPYLDAANSDRRLGSSPEPHRQLDDEREMWQPPRPAVSPGEHAPELSQEIGTQRSANPVAPGQLVQAYQQAYAYQQAQHDPVDPALAQPSAADRYASPSLSDPARYDPSYPHVIGDQRQPETMSFRPADPAYGEDREDRFPESDRRWYGLDRPDH